ncbi:MAG: MerR family transcriptional regulator [Chitinophagaceae bacterium]|nr:MerR family transcriptional regulator [Chitinophagaceae bacterium]
MPYKAHIIEKRYYSIGEVTQKTGVSEATIRYWQHELEELIGIRTFPNSKNRCFTQEDIEKILKVKYLKDKHFTLEGIKEQLSRKDSEEITQKMKLIDSLMRLREFLVKISESVK